MFSHSAGRPVMRLLATGGFSAARQRLPLAVKSSSASDQAFHRPVTGGQDAKLQDAAQEKTGVSSSVGGGGSSPQTDAKDVITPANRTRKGSSSFSSVNSVDEKLSTSNTLNRFNAKEGKEVASSNKPVHEDSIYVDTLGRNQLRNDENIEKSVAVPHEINSNSSKSSAQPSLSQTESSNENVASLEASLSSRLSSLNKASPSTSMTSENDVSQTHQSNRNNSMRDVEVGTSSPSSPGLNDGGGTAKGATEAPQVPHVTETALATVPKPKGVLGYIISRYTWYVERLQQSLESEMPRTFKMFRIFSVGLKTFIKDFTGYVRVLVVLSFPSQRLEGLSLRDLELYHMMPWDMLKVFPVLAISAVPLGQNIALPLGYLFPRQLLCRHFWDLQQTHDFSMRYLRRRVYNARPVLRSLQAPLESIEPLSARVRAQSAWHKLGSGVHPSREEVLALRPLFAGPPFSLRTIRRHHVNALVRLHGVSAPLGGRRRLKEHARWLLCHDRALANSGDKMQQQPAAHDTHNVTEGDSSPGNKFSPMDQIQACSEDGTAIHTDGTVPTLMSYYLTSADDDKLRATLTSLHVTTLKTSLLLRGISPIGLDSSGMTELLLRWLTVSRHLTKQDHSLLLHLPVLLFYNHPTNLALIAPHTRF